MYSELRAEESAIISQSAVRCTAPGLHGGEKFRVQERNQQQKKTYNKYTPHREYPISDLVCRRRTSITASRPCKQSWPWMEQVALGLVVRYHTASKASLDIEDARTFVLSNFSFINLNNRTRGSESPGVFIGIQQAISGDLGSSSRR